MLNIILVGLGITIFIYSITLFWRTYRILKEKKISLLWIILAFLVIFFLLGYAAFEYLMITGEEILSSNTLVSQIFFWGAVFVLICAKLFHSTFIVRKQMEETLLISNKQLQQEITERKQAEEALKYSEKKYRSLVDNSLVGVYQANIKGDFLFVNKALVRMLEFESPGELITRGCFEIHKNPKDREVLIENIKKKTIIAKNSIMNDIESHVDNIPSLFNIVKEKINARQTIIIIAEKSRIFTLFFLFSCFSVFSFSGILKFA